MKVLTVVGARPNFMKAAPIIAAIRQHNQDIRHKNSKRREMFEPIQHVLVHTGQHYDQAMSDSFFADLDIPAPDVHLGVGSGSHAAQTAEVMKRFEQVMIEQQPDVVVVVGDVNSTIGCALVAAKISLDSSRPRPLIAHVEAGLRSFDRSMPEEHNRILTDHLSDILFVTEESGLRNLKHEGIARRRIHFVGNTMIDSLLTFRDKADQSGILKALRLLDATRTNGSVPTAVPYALLTLHRPSNVDNPIAFAEVLDGLRVLAKELPIIFPVHPRARKRIEEFGLLRGEVLLSDSLDGEQASQTNARTRGIILVSPLGYLDFVCLMKHAKIVLTDSGGVQEETTCLRIPCVTIRENTERPCTVEKGTNVVAGTSAVAIRKAIARQLKTKSPRQAPSKWDGKAAARIVQVLCRMGMCKKPVAHASK